MAFTGNVFLTTSREAMRKIFLTKERISMFSDKVITLTEEEIQRTFVASPNSNTNLLEFDFSFGNGKQQFLKLKFLETGSIFELQFLQRTPSNSFIQKMKEELFDDSGTPKRIEDESGQKKFKYNNLDVDELQKRLFDNSTSLSENFTNIYFAFGVGDDLKSWAGPFVGSLSRSNISTNSDGLREIELIFTGAPQGLFFANILESSRERGLEFALNKFSRVVNNNVKAEASIELPYESITYSQDEKDKYYLFKVLRDLVRKYIKLVSGNDNCIVILPDTQKQFETEFYKIKENQEQRRKAEFTEIIAFGANPFQVTPITGLEGIVIKEAALFNFVAKRDRLLIRDFFSKFGIEILDPLADLDLRTKKIEAESKSQSTQPNLEPDVVKTIRRQQALGGNSYLQLADMKAEATNVNSSSIKFVMYSDKNTNTSLYRNFPDPYYSIKRITDGFKSASLGVNDDFELLEETNIKILNLWKKYGFIEDDTKPCLIYGSRSIIDSLLYLRDVTDRVSVVDTTFDTRLFKDDLKKYSSTAYRIDFFEQFLVSPINSSFGEDVLDTDEMALKEEDKQLIKIYNRPIFSYNMRNSNVLGINIDYAESFINAYNFAIKRKALLPFINSSKDSFLLNLQNNLSKELGQEDLDKIKKAVDAENISSDEELYNKLVSLVQVQEQIGGVNIKALKARSSTPVSDEEFVQLLFLILRFNSVLEKAYIEVASGDEAYVQKQILNEISKLVINVSIKTIPYFKLTKIGQICYLFALSNSIIGYENKKYLSPFSRAYSIQGFRHYISSDDMYSEFTLIANNPKYSLMASVNDPSFVKEDEVLAYYNRQARRT